MKKIQYPVKRKSFIDEDMEIAESVKERIDEAIDLLVCGFNEFKRRYRADKSFEDWMEYEEEQIKIQERKLYYLKVEHLSFSFKKELEKQLRNMQIKKD